jgi:hypothetical protein
LLVKEAQKINGYIETFLGGKKGIVINIGSSTSEFVDISQPYIRNLVLNPLSLNFKILNIDIKSQEGVDLVADFTEQNGQEQIKKLEGNLYLISNLLEHIPDYMIGIESIKSMLKSGDLLILSGPKSFPYHADPIDNMFRPSIKELRQYFENDFEIKDLQIVKSGTVFSSSVLMQNPKSTGKAIKSKGSLVNLIFNPRFMIRMVRNLFYPATAFCMFAVKK